MLRFSLGTRCFMASYGMTLCYHFTGEDRYLQAAKKVAHFFIANLPEDFVPVWDFRFLKMLPLTEIPPRERLLQVDCYYWLKVSPIESKLYRSAGENIFIPFIRIMATGKIHLRMDWFYME